MKTIDFEFTLSGILCNRYYEQGEDIWKLWF
jgi:hypothetical protein